MTSQQWLSSIPFFVVMSFCQDDYYYSTKDHIHYLVSVYCVWHALGHWSDESLHNNSVLEQTRSNCSILWQMVATLKIIQKWSSFNNNNNLVMTWSCPLQTQNTIFLTNILEHDVLKIEILRHFWLLYFGLAGGKHDEPQTCIQLSLYDPQESNVLLSIFYFASASTIESSSS